MPNTENLKHFKKGDDDRRNMDGRPVGVKNRSTIAKKILEMSAILPDEMYEKLKAAFPDIQQRMTAEEVATLVILGGAIARGDFNSYKAIMDSAYGAPKAEIEQTINGVMQLKEHKRTVEDYSDKFKPEEPGEM